MEAVQLIADGKAPRVPQSEEGATYEGIQRKENAEVFISTQLRISEFTLPTFEQLSVYHFLNERMISKPPAPSLPKSATDGEKCFYCLCDLRSSTCALRIPRSLGISLLELYITGSEVTIKSLEPGQRLMDRYVQGAQCFARHVTVLRGVAHESRLPLVLPLLVRRVCVLGTRGQLKDFRYTWPAEGF